MTVSLYTAVHRGSVPSRYRGSGCLFLPRTSVPAPSRYRGSVHHCVWAMGMAPQNCAFRSARRMRPRSRKWHSITRQGQDVDDAKCRLQGSRQDLSRTPNMRCDCTVERHKPNKRLLSNKRGCLGCLTQSFSRRIRTAWATVPLKLQFNSTTQAVHSQQLQPCEMWSRPLFHRARSS